VGDSNPVAPCWHCLLDKGDLKLSMVINVSMDMLHEVTSCVAGDDLDAIKMKKTIILEAQLDATIYEQPTGLN